MAKYPSQFVGKRRGPNRLCGMVQGKCLLEDDPLSPLPDVLLPSQFFELVGSQTFSRSNV